MKTHYPLFLVASLTLVPGLLRAQSSAQPTPDMPTAQPAPAANPAAQEPALGDPVNTVLTALGRPNGVITLPDKANMLIYDRGTIVIADGKVSELKLMPLANYNAKLAAEATVEAEHQASLARTNALLQMLVSDPSYQAMSTRDRMTALAKFEREHPGSDARKYLSDLSTVYSAEQLAQARIQDLQNQVALSRSQLSSAQQQVADAQKRLLDAQQTATVAKSQADALRQQAAQAQSQPANANPLVMSNSPGSKAGVGGVVLAPNSFGTTTMNTNPPATPTTPNNGQGQWVIGPDGATVRYNGPPPSGTAGK